MRGVGHHPSLAFANPGRGGGPTIGPAVDQAEAFSALVGVQQIEVNADRRVPLFGKSADAGGVRITTAQPTDQFTFFSGRK